MISEKRFFPLLFLSLAIFLIFVTGCRNDPQTSEANGKIEVAVGILPIQAFVEAVCGDYANVITMIPSGYSPENYEPAFKEARQLETAAVYFSIGVPAEINNILPKIQDKKIADLAGAVSQAYPDREINEGERDPHIWLSPKRVKVMTEVIAREMSLIDPVHADVYLQNKDAFLADLDQLDADLKIMFDSMENQSFFIFHPSCGYLADDYGLRMLALEQHGKEATPRHLQEMIDLARLLQVKTVFAQAEIDSRQLDAFADETGCRIEVVDPLSADYLTNMRKMAKAISEAMQDG